MESREFNEVSSRTGSHSEWRRKGALLFEAVHVICYRTNRRGQKTCSPLCQAGRTRRRTRLSHTEHIHGPQPELRCCIAGRQTIVSRLTEIEIEIRCNNLLQELRQRYARIGEDEDGGSLLTLTCSFFFLFLLLFPLLCQASDRERSVWHEC